MSSYAKPSNARSTQQSTNTGGVSWSNSNKTNTPFNFGGQKKDSTDSNYNKTVQEEDTIEKLGKRGDDNKSAAADGVPAAANYIIELYNVVEKYSKDIKPIEGAESFDKSLREIEASANRAIVHTLMTLGNEIDRGTVIKNSFRAELDTYRNDLTDIRSGATFPIPFVTRYVENLRSRSQNIRKAIDSLHQKLETKESDSQSLQTIKEIVETQNQVIGEAAAQVATIHEKSMQIREKVISTLKRRRSQSELIYKIEEGDEESHSVVEKIQSDYDTFIAEQKRNLDKRETNRELFIKPPQAQSSFGSFGKSGSGFGTGGKTTTGFTSGFGTGSTSGAGSGKTTTAFGSTSGGVKKSPGQ